MQILNVQQGTQEWAAVRATHNTASEAPAMMSASKYQSRSDLLHQKSTGIVPEVDSAKQRLFDRGHATEAAARAILESQLGEELFPITATSDTGNLLASMDGITMDGATLFEHKLWSELLAAQVRAKELVPHYYWQLEQQLLVSGAERVIFVCSDGTIDKWEQMEYRPVVGRSNALVDGWAQFEKDVASFVPVTVVEKPKADAIMDLPALFLHAQGEITSSNLEEFGAALATSLDAARRTALITDQDFANAEAAAKLYRETCKKLMLAKDAMLAQTVSIGEAARMIDAWHEDLRVTALKLEKDVEKERDAKKTAIINVARLAYADHVAALDKEITPARLNIAPPDFAGAMKGKRLVSAWQDAVDGALANGKIAADAAAKAIRANLAVFHRDAEGYEFLFADLAQLVTKAADDFALVVQTRIEARKQAEQKAKEEAEAAASKAIAEAQKAPEPVIQTTAAVVTPLLVRTPVAASTPPTLKLGQIGERLGFNLTADFLKSLGFEPAARDRASLLFHEADFGLICAALVQHIQSIQQKKVAA